MVARNFSGAPILYEKMGGGEPLLLVHGLMATGEIFGPVIDAFARRHTVVVPDLRGHGRSMHLEGPLTVEQHVRDLIRVETILTSWGRMSSATRKGARSPCRSPMTILSGCAG